MGDPVSSAVMGGMNAAGKALSIAGGVAGGIQQKAAQQVRAIQLRTAAEAGRTRAAQSDAAYTEELSTVLQNIGVIRAAQNTSGSSPTEFALMEEAGRRNRRARTLARDNEQLKVLGLEGDARSALAAGDAAMTAAWLKVAPDALSLAQSGFEKAKGFLPKG